jgi:Domain of unknown function (DUF4287)
MSFQAYIDNIKAKTGQSPEDFKNQMVADGTFSLDMKAGVLVTWLKDNYEVGHGHAMAIWAVFKNEGWMNDGKKK